MNNYIKWQIIQISPAMKFLSCRKIFYSIWYTEALIKFCDVTRFFTYILSENLETFQFCNISFWVSREFQKCLVHKVEILNMYNSVFQISMNNVCYCLHLYIYMRLWAKFWFIKKHGFPSQFVYVESYSKNEISLKVGPVPHYIFPYIF